MKSVWLLTLLVLAACAPARTLEPFTERRPDPIRDQGAHRAPVEWWYLNGHLETPSGPKGYAAAIFQVLIPESSQLGLIPLASVFPDAFYFGHVSMVDKTTGAFRSSELSTLPGAKPDVKTTVGSAATDRMDVRLGDWRMARETNGVYTVKTSMQGKEPLELTLTPERPEVIHGPGWSGTKDTGRMYYCSATRLRAQGTLNGEPVTGLFWFDHQWGGSDGGDGSAYITPRWDWFSLQLEDGRDLMVYRVRNAQGGTADLFVGLHTPDGRSSEIREFTLSPWRYWKAPSGASYPLDWFLKLPDGTALTIRAVTDNQEVQSRATAGFNYYEGAVQVTGSVRGVGYMELTGYDTPRANPFSNPFGFLPNR